MKTIHFHGELVVIENTETEITGVEIKGEQDVKLADSEVSGNDHMLKVIPGIVTFRDEDLDKFFVKAEVDTKIYCKIKDRHDDLVLKGGVNYEIFPAREYDHIRDAIRNVRD